MVKNLYFEAVEGQTDAHDRKSALIKRNNALPILVTNPFIFIRD